MLMVAAEAGPAVTAPVTTRVAAAQAVPIILRSFMLVCQSFFGDPEAVVVYGVPSRG